MSMKIRVGVAQKLGTPDYGSLAANCEVQFEADSALLQNDPPGFHQRVGQVYNACRQAVLEELARQRKIRNADHDAAELVLEGEVPGQLGPAFPTPAHSGNGNGGHPASEKQAEYIRQLARQIPGLGVRRLDAVAGRMFGKSMAELSSLDASGLINALKDIKAGNMALDAAIGEAAT